MNKPATRDVQIVTATPEDLDEIIKITFAVFEVDRYFMLKIGEEFLLDCFKIIFEKNSAHFFVAKDGAKVIGFVVGYPDTSAVSAALRRNAPRIGLRFLRGKYAMRMGLRELIADGYKNFRYMSRPQAGGAGGELMSMAVLQDYQGQGIGARLMGHLEASFKGLTEKYLILTHRRLVKTVQFYLKMGCKEHASLRNNEIVIFEKSLPNSRG